MIRMTNILALTCAWAMSLGLVAITTHASPREDAQGVMVDDFEDGKLDQFAGQEMPEHRVPKTLEIVEDEGKKALHLEGRFHTRLYYGDNTFYYGENTFKDFIIETRIKKMKGAYAGLVVRDNLYVYFQMRGALCLNSETDNVLRFQSSQSFTGYHNLKVACVGPILRGYVDDKRIFEQRIPPGGAGRVGLYAHDGEAYYDSVRISTRIDPLEGLFFDPKAPDDNSLVFRPGENVKLEFNAGNYSAAPQKAELAAAIETWDGKAVSREARREVALAPGSNRVEAFEMGPVAAGFYRVNFKAVSGGKLVCEINDLPLAVQERGPGDYKAPAIPVGGYYSHGNAESALYICTYAHANGRTLRDNGFNAVIADSCFTKDVIDILQSYGIATISRSGTFLEHPAVIATLVLDEPKPPRIEEVKTGYESVRQKSDKPVTSCMVGEPMGLGVPLDPVLMWRELKPDIRLFRWYGVKKDFYGVQYDLKAKGWLPFASVMRIAEASSDTPYWLVAQAVGVTNAYAYYAIASPGEVRGMMHLALANGAQGILFWQLQTCDRWIGLLDQRSLQPVDGRYAAAAEVAGLVKKHAKLLLALKPGSLDVRCRSPQIEVVPRLGTGEEQGRHYVYMVNKNTREPVTTELFVWSGAWQLGRVSSVFSGKDLKILPDKDGYLTIPITLKPGEGDLIATDAKQKK